MRTEIIDLGDGRQATVHAVDASEVQAIRDNCAALRGVGHVGSKDMKLAASVSGWIILDWCNKKGVSWGRFMRESDLRVLFLDDPDNADFRIWEGKI